MKLSLLYRYQHNIELVKFLNFFANKSAQLPHGWEKKDCSSKVFIISPLFSWGSFNCMRYLINGQDIWCFTLYSILADSDVHYRNILDFLLGPRHKDDYVHRPSSALLETIATLADLATEHCKPRTYKQHKQWFRLGLPSICLSALFSNYYII